jgi:hypothetical protein
MKSRAAIKTPQLEYFFNIPKIDAGGRPQRQQSWAGLYLANCEFQTLEISMFSGIERTALTLHIGYTTGSFLIHIETLPSARDNKFSPIRISGSNSIHAVWYRMDNKNLSSFA